MAEIENLQIVGGAIYTVGNQDIIADDWEAGKAYIKDRSYAIKDHKLYQCAVSHTSVEPFDPTKWTEKTVAEALGTAGSANMIECTLAEYTAWKAGGQLINETVYVITDAPNLNATAQDISYDGGADTVWDKVEAVDELANKYNDASLLCTATVIEPTLSNGTSVNHRTYYYKKGTRVFVSIAVSGLTANTNQLLFTLPSGYRPSTIILPIGCDDSFNLNTVLLVKTDGNIEMRKNATQAYAFFEFDAFA